MPRLSSPIFHRSLIAFSILVASLTTGCSPIPGDEKATPNADAEPKALRISQASDVRSMDPYFALESPTYGVLSNIFEGLTDIDEEMNIVPQLAESWENLDDTTWEFRLRQGVRFHGGEEFDAEDVRFSIRRAIDWPQSRLRSEIPSVTGVEILDPHLIHIKTSVPDAILPTRLGSLFILDKESSEAYEKMDEALATNPNGTGPYRLTKWIKDDRCLLEAYPEHWAGAPSVERMNFLAMSNEATRMAAFLNGDIDVLIHVPVNDVARVEAMPGFSLIRKPGLRLIYLGLDVGRAQSPTVTGAPTNPLQDLRVRQAIYAAINEDLIIEKILNGLAVPAAQLFPAAVVGHDPEIKREPYDLEKAKRLMEEAGYGEGFGIALDAPNDRYINDEGIATAIAGQLAKINIRVEVRAVPKARFFPLEQAGDSSFFLIGWSNTNGDGNGTFDHLLHTSDREKNVGGSNTSTVYSNPEVDRLAEAAWSEFDPEKRSELLRQATRLVIHDLPHIPLHYQMDLYAVSDRIEWAPRHDTQVRGNRVAWKD